MGLSVSLGFKQYADDKLVSFSNTSYKSRKVYEFQIIAQGTNGLTSGASTPVAIFVS